MAELAITNVQDLFCDILLEDDKKLCAFSKNPILSRTGKVNGQGTSEQ